LHQLPSYLAPPSKPEQCLITANVAISPAMETRYNSVLKSQKDVAVRSAVPVHAPMPPPVSQICRVCAAKFASNNNPKEIAESETARYTRQDRVIPRSTNAANPAMVPTIGQDTGPNTDSDGIANAMPDIAASMTAGRSRNPHMLEKRNHDATAVAIMTDAPKDAVQSAFVII